MADKPFRDSSGNVVKHGDSAGENRVWQRDDTQPATGEISEPRLRAASTVGRRNMYDHTAEEFPAFQGQDKARARMGQQFPNEGSYAKGGKVSPLKFNNKPVMAHPGKGSQMLPGRGALRALSKIPGGATLGDYAKLTPSGANAPGSYADIQHMGEPKLK